MSACLFNSLHTSDSFMRTLANSVDPDEMPHSATFYQGLHCLHRKEIQYFLEITTCDLSIYTMDHHKFIVSNQKEESISAQGVKCHPLLQVKNDLET